MTPFCFSVPVNQRPSHFPNQLTANTQKKENNLCVRRLRLRGRRATADNISLSKVLNYTLYCNIPQALLLPLLLLTAELRPAEEEVTTLAQVRAADGSSPVSWLLRRVARAYQGRALSKIKSRRVQ